MPGSLHQALERGDEEEAVRLIEAGAPLETVESTKGDTPLLVAARCGMTSVVAALLKAGALVEATNRDRATPVILAALEGQLGVLQLLISAGARVDMPANGVTPVFMAAEKGQTAALALLIAANADVDTPVSDGFTPISVSAAQGHVEALELLLCAGGNPCAKNEYGETPLGQAESGGHGKCAAMLRLASLELRSPISRVELNLLAQPGVLESAFPAAFHNSPFEAIETLATLVGECRVAGPLDMEGGEAMLALVLRAQQLAVGLLRALPRTRLVQELRKPPGMAAIKALVTNSCKVVLADALIQQVVDEQWRVIPPRSLFEAALIIPQTLGHIIVITFFPAYADHLAAKCEAQRAKAAHDVKIKNPEPKRPAQRNEPVYFKVDDKIVSTSWSGPLNDSGWAVARDTFLKRRARTAAAKSVLELRFFSSIQPQMRFTLSVIFQLLFAILLAFLPEDIDLTAGILLVWALQLVAYKLYVCYESPRLWLADHLNSLELASSIFACLAIVLRPGWSVAAQSTQAASIVLIWTAQSARLLQQSATLGPLVLMTIEIIGDTFRFLLLILGSLLGFSWSFYALFKRGPQEEASNGLEEGCAVLRSNDGFGVFGAALFLFEILLGSDNQLDCLRASPHASLAAGTMDICELGSTRKSTNPSLPLHSMADLGYDTLECLRPHSYHYEKRVCATSCLTVLVVFLLLGSNMLIALMAKTVDRVYDHQGVNYKYLSALTFVSWSRAQVVPPPFAILGLPSLLCQKGFSIGSSCFSENNKHELLKEGSPEAMALMEDIPVSKLKKRMEAYADENAGEQGEDFIWWKQIAKQQAQLARQMAQMEDQMTKQQLKLTKQLAEIANEVNPKSTGHFP